MAHGLALTEGRLWEALGGVRVLRAGRGKPPALRARVRSGLPYACLETLATRFSIGREELTVVLALPPRTLARRKRERRLRADESDRLLRLGRIAVLAEEVLGDRERAGRWLHEPSQALGGERPLDLLDTDLGARQVEDVLTRLAHGVHS